ncbi:hypothetical protein [Halobellus salinisoli]|uniref:hypothetical protein n=1 Tax=Halobellus salinisoli TaxID=3108500 RepID=UPI003009EC75
MVPSITTVLLGRNRTARHRYVLVALAVGSFFATFAGYALGMFDVSGGIVWIPFYAAVVGMIAAGWVGYHRAGLVFGWVVTYTSLLGWHADWALYAISRRPLADRIAYFVRPDGLAFLAVQAFILGTLAFILGLLVRWGSASLRSETSPFVGDE